MYKTANDYYNEKFGDKVYKLSIDAGFTCPNRDGTLGEIGCIFCLGGSGEFAEKGSNISEQLEKAKRIVESKIKSGKYIAYLQSFTNTYAPIEKLKEVDIITIYNDDNDSGIITFNVKDVFAQDAASLFNSYGIAVRSGEHCAKILLNKLNAPATVRASLYFYNTFEEIDAFIEVCKKGGDFLDAYFN